MNDFGAVGFEREKSKKLLNEVISEAIKLKIEEIKQSPNRIIQLTIMCGEKFGLNVDVIFIPTGGGQVKTNVFYKINGTYFDNYPSINVDIDRETVQVAADIKIRNEDGHRYRFKVINQSELVEKINLNGSAHMKRASLIGIGKEGEILLPVSTEEKHDPYYDKEKGILKIADKFSFSKGFLKSLDDYKVESKDYIYELCGTIVDVKHEENSYTKEEVVLLVVKFRSAYFTVIINKLKLLGEPLKGRRFCGVISAQCILDME
ncbi:protein of unknown function [Lachnospiraceae bacterium RM5]|nr:protein of unknown function [Lachnospiraceae bacterium RM5]